MTDPLTLKNVSFSYEDNSNVLQDISFSIQENQTIGLVGQNGAGKTTLFMVICGVLKTSQGEVLIYDVPVQYRQFCRDIGYVFQNPDNQLFSPTVWDDIAFGPINMALNDIDEIVAKSSQMCNCDHLLQRPSHHLSGGEKRMVAIASVLSLDPKVVIYDEPTSNLDVKSRRKVIEIIQSSQKTNLVASHDLEFIVEICQQVIVMNQGKIISIGPAKDIMSNEQLMHENGLEVPYSLRN